MRKVVVNEWITLDGVMQAPGYKDEDPSGGFEHGGWHLPYFDDVSRAWVVEGYADAGGFLFGRSTYESLASYWPNAAAEEQGVARPLNTLPKYVASTTLAGPLHWQNSTLLHGDIVDAVAALKRQDGKDLHLIGSSELARTLIAHDLVDEFRVMIDPVLVGGGKRILCDDGVRRPLRLLDSKISTTGAILATYATIQE
jgi:dihydrofolate reductase